MCKKVLLVIVEGETDETALKSSLENIFEDKETYVYVVGGDITSNWDVPDDELCDEIEAILNEIMTRYGLTEEDFLGIIHVSDTDGAFIKSKYVVLDKSESYPRNEDKIYSESEIRTSHRIKYIQRNRRKKRRMNTLLANANILDVKYGFYYMSSCLDHVLYDKTNLSGKQKRIEADSFNEKYREDVDAFIDFICNSDFSVQGSYEETWDYIKHGTNSLKRHTNLRLAIEEYKNDEKAE